MDVMDGLAGQDGAGRERGRDKTALRTSILAARRMSWAGGCEHVNDATQRAVAVVDLLATLPRAGSGEPLVLSYLAFPDEPDTAVLHRLLRDRGIAVALVRMRSDAGLDVVAWGPGDELAAGPRGTRAPGGPALDPALVDLAIVPALAVDPATGMRLGRGGGSYDRFLPLLRTDTPVLAALAGPQELLDLSGVTEPHDRPVSAVALPQGVRHK
jgi:5-formyltetrahydrofolate cyclo-ligase